ncbi:ABC transporter permease [Candidatus Saccharibacteria bacterium]|nr:MAG: ABC transporter permease [Candidatus Saccharibacteria bacterium]
MDGQKRASGCAAGADNHFSHDVPFWQLFPRFLMPEWLQGITNYLPLTPVIDAARLIITENRGVLDLLPQFGIILGWCVVVYILAFRFFRWE